MSLLSRTEGKIASGEIKLEFKSQQPTPSETEDATALAARIQRAKAMQARLDQRTGVAAVTETTQHVQ
jgi:hypothetical protein